MSLAAAIASSSSANPLTGATGPKISSLEELGVVGDVGQHRGVVEVAGAVAGVAADERARAASDGVLDELGDLARAGCRRSAARPRRRPRCRGRPSSRPSCSASFSANSSATASATWKRLAAVHASPMLRILAIIAPWTAASMSASSKTMNGRVAAELHRQPQQVLGRLLHQLAPDLGRAGERQLAQPRIGDQRAGRLARRGGGDQVQHAARKPGLLEDLGEHQHRQRRLLGGLDDHRAAGGDRRARSCGCPSPAGSSTA